MNEIIGCEKCGHLACVCRVQRDHVPDCKYRLAVCCAVGIECEHGYDVCPTCDPCTCKTKTKPDYGPHKKEIGHGMDRNRPGAA